jgi:uncharacterized protein
MSQFDAQFWIVRLFLRLRQRGYLLGVDEYQAALKAAETGYAQSGEALLEMVQILWCHSRSQQNQIVPIWQALQREMEKQQMRLEEAKPELAADTGSKTKAAELNKACIGLARASAICAN